MAMDLAHGGELRSLIASEHQRNNAALANEMSLNSTTSSNQSIVITEITSKEDAFLFDNSFNSEYDRPRIESYKACDTYTAKFYLAEIIEAVEYLHEQGVIHRWVNRMFYIFVFYNMQ
jgi:serine/threonine protein kinase